MDKAEIAEWALARAMEPVRAASVVGDLLEADAPRGAIRFWSDVLRTLAGTVWHDLRARPLFFAGLAARGAFLLCAFLFFVWHTRTFASGFVRTAFSHRWPARHPKEWLWPGMELVSFLATLYAGGWLARRSLGRDFAVGVAMAVVFPFVYYGFGTLLAAWASIGAHQHLLPLPFDKFWYHLRDAGFIAAFLLGMALVRRREPAACAA